jgi:iron(III) transport system substrate-binding protein
MLIGSAGVIIALGVMVGAWVDGAGPARADDAESLVLYCGRGQSLVGPLIEKFRAQTGIDVKVKYGGTTELVATLAEERDRSPADVFWAQDAASLGQLSRDGRFSRLPDSITGVVAENFRSSSGTWVATSGRARVLAYSPSRVKAQDLPASVFDLTDPKWKGRIGWAPTNASFLAFVTAMRVEHGDDKTRQWLIGMKNNSPKAYPKNSPIIEAIASGEIDLGLPNHYYLLRYRAMDPNYPVAQTFFRDGDIGNLLLVSGVGVLKTALNKDAAHKFIEFLLSPDTAQSFLASEDMEYPVVRGAAVPEQLPGKGAMERVTPRIDLDKLSDLEGTRKLMSEVGL